MIEAESLKTLLEKYGINFNKLIANNDNAIWKGNYKDIEATLDYLINELKIEPRNIEKAPSILYLNVLAIRRNVEFLRKQNVSFSSVETCLHVLNTDPLRLEETYNYVKDNYGIEYIDRITTILKIDVERIKAIEKFGLNKEITLSASIIRISIENIFANIMICRENNIEPAGSVFQRTSKELEEVIRICRENNIKPIGKVFYNTPKDVEEIIKICKENNVEPTGSVFRRTSKELEEIIRICRENNIEPVGIVFQRTSKKLEEIIRICRENNIEPVGIVFQRTSKDVKEIIRICRENNIELSSSIFTKSPIQIQRSIDFIKENYDESYLKSLIVVIDEKHLREVFTYLKELGVLDTVKKSSSILKLKLEEIKERKDFIDSIGEKMVLDNGKFNSVFGMIKKKYAKKIESYLNQDSSKKM